MSFQGYYQRPTLMGNNLVFVFEDDLWLRDLSSDSPSAYRLTANPGRVNDPQLCPDGIHLAYTSLDEGHPEVFVTRLDAMEAKRLTYLGEDTRCIGWTRDAESVLFATNASNAFGRVFRLAMVKKTGGPAERIHLGPAAHISYSAKKGQVIGRHTWDPARWKRYRGGTAGQIWVDPQEKGQFKLLVELDGNLTRPIWVGDRIFFGSDHEGICNLYSCHPDGSDLQACTHHDDFFIRYPNSDGERVVYQCGGDIFLYDPKVGVSEKVEITVHSQRSRLARRFVSPTRFLESYALSPDGSQTAIGTRGKPYTFAHWEGPVRQLGDRDGTRYRLLQWSKRGVVCVNDSQGDEEIGIFDNKDDQYLSLTSGVNIGRILNLGISPCGEKAWFSNHRHELYAIEFPPSEADSKNTKKTSKSKKKSKPAKAKLVKVAEDRFTRITDASWSPDGQWLAYSLSLNRQDSQIVLWNWDTKKAQAITQAPFRDWSPDFDPEGRYLYFISCRDFDPVKDNMFFEYSFPKAARPYLITLQKEQPDPFLSRPRAPGEDPPAAPSPYFEDKPEKKASKTKAKSKAKTKAASKKKKESVTEKIDKDTPNESKKIRIDFEGIEERVRVFPVDEGRYYGVIAAKGRLFMGLSPVRSSLNSATAPGDGPSGMLAQYDFKKLEFSVPINSVSGFDLSADRSTLIYRSGRSVRVCKASAVSAPGSERTATRSTGWLDLGRIKVSVKPIAEWEQMLREAWRLMRDHFWDENMSQVDWNEVLERYTPLLSRLSTRREFSDLLWEFQGELGTSHAYEYGGDYDHGPHFAQGKLAATLKWEAKSKAYSVVEIAKGDAWCTESSSPLRILHHPLEPGDHIVAVNGHRLSYEHPPEEYLVNQADQNVELTVIRHSSHRGKGKAKEENVTVHALRRETPTRYREWVESNRAFVHEKSKGRVGYIHIPNMSAVGFAEFHRGYYSEVEKDGLVIDVRYNGGGNVSQLLLEKLARKRLGFDVQRWGAPIPYPQESPAGPLVAITNEEAGSDGDIFSHCFKLMGLGPLIGKRTWGGTIGIWPRHPLVDGTITTQPEFAFWFQDVGWGVENYGTDPDEVIEIRPQDWAKGKDPQIERAVKLALSGLKASPPLELPQQQHQNRPNRSR